MTSEPEVRVGNGSVLGAHLDGVAVFTGIPYAAAPAGPNRFTAPQPATWQGRFDAREYGPTAPQAATDLPDGLDLKALIGPGWQQGEDYLNLNVWTPDPSGSGLPVMVFIHGGGFTGGSGSTSGYDGTRFAQDGVVLVTLNYRLGVAGFAHLPGAPDNRGLLDQIAALEWVREHISGFGGDPDNITVFGESAGAISVGALLAAAPPGLFRRAISQSGGASHALTRSQAEVVTTAVADHFGVPATAEAFSGLSEQALVDALIHVTRVTGVDLAVDGVRDPLMGLAPVGPVIDGELLHQQPVDSVRAGAAAEVDLLVGNNRDEMNLYLVALPSGEITDDMVVIAASALHPEPARLIEAYRGAERGADAGGLLASLGTDYMFAVPTAQLAQAHAGHAAGTWRYEFTWHSPAFDGRLGACHGIELPFVFDVIGRADYRALGVDPDDESIRQLAKRTHAAWIAFARDGDPGWARYTENDPVTQRIGSEWTITEHPDGPERGMWSPA